MKSKLRHANSIGRLFLKRDEPYPGSSIYIITPWLTTPFGTCMLSAFHITPAPLLELLTRISNQPCESRVAGASNAFQMNQLTREQSGKGILPSAASWQSVFCLNFLRGKTPQLAPGASASQLSTEPITDCKVCRTPGLVDRLNKKLTGERRPPLSHVHVYAS